MGEKRELVGTYYQELLPTYLPRVLVGYEFYILTFTNYGHQLSLPVHQELRVRSHGPAGGGQESAECTRTQGYRSRDGLIMPAESGSTGRRPRPRPARPPSPASHPGLIRGRRSTIPSLVRRHRTTNC